MKRQVKIRGFQIELGAIEARLTQHPMVRDAVVIAREDPSGEPRLIVYYTLADTSAQPEGVPEAESPSDHLANCLPSTVPVAYVRLQSLPVGHKGKMDLMALPEPDASAYATRGYETPQNEIETQLAAIWADVLNLERVGRQDNFFELGGYSLQAVRVVTGIRRALGTKVSSEDLYAHPVLSEFAVRVASAAPGELTATDRAEPIPLSFAQERLWFLEQLGGVNEAYHISLGVRLKGKLDRDALHRTLDCIFARHEALRTTFALVDGKPVQRVSPAKDARMILLEHDLVSHADPSAELDRLVALGANIRFDLESGPLIRARLIRLSQNEHALLITMHHLVTDGWSIGLLVKEMSILYRAFLRGEDNPLAELPVQYSDYAIWHRNWMASDSVRQQAEYWKTTLAGAPALLELPMDHPRPANQDYAGGFAQIVLDEDLTAGLKALSKRHGMTLYMTLLAAWTMLLARLSGQQDVVTGTPVANRGRSEIEGLIGFFVNTLALRVDLSGEPTVSELLQRVKAAVIAAQQHQDIPFQRVVELTCPVRSLSYNPLFQAMFLWHNTNQEQLSLPGLETEPLPSAVRRMAKFDVTLALRATGRVIAGGLEYATALFEPSTAKRFLEYLHRLLREMVDDDSQPVDCLPMLSEPERKRVLYEWNETTVEFPRDICVHELLEEQVRKTPNALAVVFGDQQLTYGDLNRRANRLAHYLRELGVKPEARVAICLERGLEMIVGLLAVLKAGGAYLPMDPIYPAERLRWMLEDSAPTVLLTQQDRQGVFAGVGANLPVLDLAGAETPWSKYPDRNIEREINGLSSKSLAYVIYTSGSTGAPKGVMVEHRNLANLICWHGNAFALKCSDRTSSVTGVGFDASTWEIWPTLCAGAVIVMPSSEKATDAGALLSWWKAQDLDVSFLPTPVAEFAFRSGLVNTRLRILLIGGDRLRNLPLSLPPISIVNNYGPTEATVVATSGHLGTAAQILSIGRPIANTRVYILDRQGEPVPVGVTGELYIGGAQVARGYLNRADLTAERFSRDPFFADAEGRMYRTGDLGRWLPDGNIEFVGRNDFQVKVRGFRIELAEIEAQMIQHPGVGEAVVVASEQESGETRLVAYYTGKPKAGAADQFAASGEELQRYLGVKLPDYMVPAAYVRLESMPLTANGKLERKSLPPPEGDAYARRRYEEPVGEKEKALAEIWADVLKVERVGRHDNFFELGGHSLLAVTLIERTRRFGLPVDLRTLFAAPTVAGVGAAIGPQETLVVVPPNRIPQHCEVIKAEMLPLLELSQEEIDLIVKSVPGGARNVQDIYPLAPLQEGILFHHLMEGEGDPYLLGSQRSFDTRARLGAYLAAMQAVINRHDILRTAVAWEGLREPVQVVWRQAVMAVEEVELDSSERDMAAEMYERFNPRRYRMDVRQAPLLRAYIAYDQDKDRWLLVQLVHHLTGDQGTMELMQEEIQAYLLGEEKRLPAPQPFRNLVAQARFGMSREEHEVFFRELLGNVEEPTAPFGLLDVHGDGTRLDEKRMLLNAGLARRVRERARKLGVSAATLFHVAWARVLARVSGGEDVVFGTVLLGRMQGGGGSQRGMGPFINTLPVRIQVGDGGVESSVLRTHVLLAELLHHEHASLALAQRCSRVPAPLPLFSSLLNYRHSAGAARIRSSDAMRAWAGIKTLHAEERTNYPLALSVEDLGEDFGLTAQVEAPIKPKRVCEYMAIALESLVDALEKAPTLALRSLDVLSEHERQLVLYGWNDTVAQFPQDRRIHELFEEPVRKTPAAVALVYGDQELSYAELNLRANQLAHYLRELGVKSGERIGICAHRGFEMVVGLFAILKAGGAYVPLDPNYPAARLRYMLEDSGPTVLLIQGHLRGLFREYTDGLRVLELDSPSSVWRDQPRVNLEASEIGPNSEDAAYVIYTSGSTGAPKGVQGTHAGMLNRLHWMWRHFPFRGADIGCVKTSLSFIDSFWEIFGFILRGTPAILIRDEVVKDPEQLIRELEIAGVTRIVLVPSLLRAMLDTGPNIAEQLRNLTFWVSSGEELSPELAGRFHQTFPEARLLNLYGSSEVSADATCYESTKASGRAVPIGRPISNTRVYILDRWREPVPVGVVGELYIGGVGVARGYLNHTELTVERFLQDPFAGEATARMYRTGDMGRWLPDGDIEFLGRNDFQVKVRGFRIDLGEIEARLLEHPAVDEAVVIARENSTGDNRLVAYYTCIAESTADMGAELRSYLSAMLPEYMVPSAYLSLKALPVTPSGKLDRRALPAPNWTAEVSHCAPRSPEEELLCNLFAEVLGIPQVGVDDNFFLLGGHSLLAVSLIGRIRAKLRLDVSLHTLFDFPSPKQLRQELFG